MILAKMHFGAQLHLKYNNSLLDSTRRIDHFFIKEMVLFIDLLHSTVFVGQTYEKKISLYYNHQIFRYINGFSSECFVIL